MNNLAAKSATSICAYVLTASMLLSPGAYGQQTTLVEAEIIQFTMSEVVILTEDARQVRFKVERAKTLCFDDRGSPWACEGFALVGYADKARITLLGDVAQRIEIIELQQ